MTVIFFEGHHFPQKKLPLQIFQALLYQGKKAKKAARKANSAGGLYVLAYPQGNEELQKIPRPRNDNFESDLHACFYHEHLYLLAPASMPKPEINVQTRRMRISGPLIEIKEGSLPYLAITKHHKDPQRGRSAKKRRLKIPEII